MTRGIVGSLKIPMAWVEEAKVRINSLYFVLFLTQRSTGPAYSSIRLSTLSVTENSSMPTSYSWQQGFTTPLTTSQC